MVLRDDREALAAKNEVLERELGDRSRKLRDAQSELQATSDALAEKEKELAKANQALAQHRPATRETRARTPLILGVAIAFFFTALGAGFYIFLSAAPMDPPVG